MHADHFQFVTEQRLEFLLKTEGERQPTHVTGVTSLPEVDDAAKVIVNCVVVCLSPAL